MFWKRITTSVFRKTGLTMMWIAQEDDISIWRKHLSFHKHLSGQPVFADKLSWIWYMKPRANFWPLKALCCTGQHNYDVQLVTKVLISWPRWGRMKIIRGVTPNSSAEVSLLLLSFFQLEINFIYPLKIQALFYSCTQIHTPFSHTYTLNFRYTATHTIFQARM